MPRKKARSKTKKRSSARKKALKTLNSGLGKGYKACVNCGSRIPSRCATCKKCGFIYSFKGKPRTKLNLLEQRLLASNPHLTINDNKIKSENKENINLEQSNFIKQRYNYTKIAPSMKPVLTNNTFDDYIKETQLLMEVSIEQLNIGDLNSSSKILDRLYQNLTFLGTAVDIQNYYKNNPTIPKM